MCPEIAWRLDMLEHYVARRSGSDCDANVDAAARVAEDRDVEADRARRYIYAATGRIKHTVRAKVRGLEQRSPKRKFAGVKCSRFTQARIIRRRGPGVRHDR